MAKRRRDCSASVRRSGKSQSPCISSLESEANSSRPSATEEQMKEWEDARCPVCMEHPHNAVLLICSSYTKGCHPYMCDTSQRHSNCLDQFRKSFAEASNATSPEEGQPNAGSSDVLTVKTNAQEEAKTQAPNNFPSMHKLEQKLVCPLCRGQVSGWIVVQSARDFMNTKIRSCACETCEFTGNYRDLRKHARLEHPEVKPSEADPQRQRRWRRLESQRDIGDVLSSMRSSLEEDDEEDPDVVSPFEEYNGLFTIFVFFEVTWTPSERLRGSSRSGATRAQTRAQQHVIAEASSVGGEDDEYSWTPSVRPGASRRLGATSRAGTRAQQHAIEVSSASEEDDESSGAAAAPWPRPATWPRWRRLRRVHRQHSHDAEVRSASLEAGESSGGDFVALGGRRGVRRRLSIPDDEI